MHKKAPTLALAAIMILSSFAVFVSDTSVAANFNNSGPETPVSGTFTGNVVIYPNGTFTGGTPLKQSSSNDFYLTENVSGTITDQMNGSTLNGNGYTVNGGQSSAIVAGNVTGITIENLAAVNINQATDGIHLYNVYNSVVDNVSINNANDVAVTMVWLYYSGNVTIENSNFLLGSTTTNSYGIDAEYDSSVNVSFNNFFGAISPLGYNGFVYGNVVGQLTAIGNNINSSSNSGTGFLVECGGNINLSGNYINDTNYAFEAVAEQSISSMKNHITNSTYGLYVEYASSFTSYNDTAIFNEFPIYLENVGYVMVQYGNFTNATSYSYFYYVNYGTVSNSTFSSSGTNVIDVNDGATMNLYNDQIILSSSSSSSQAVYAGSMSGRFNMANDYVYAPNSYGLYFDYMPEFSVINSVFNATNSIYTDYNYAIASATISGNTFMGEGFGYVINLSAVYDLFNVNITNNILKYPNLSWGYYGISIWAQYLSSNITIYGNSITNVINAVYLNTPYGNSAANAYVLNNTITNTGFAINDKGYYNTVISGNKISNVSHEAVIARSSGCPGIIVSNNLIENSAGAETSYGIDVSNFQGGHNIISNNRIIVPASSTHGISVSGSYPVLVYSNTVNGGETGINISDSNTILAFDNEVSNSGYGIESNYNTNFSYYSNTVDNSTYSLYSYGDYGGTVFANTFADYQANSSQLYFLTIEDYDAITFYHNNILNSTVNSTTYNYITSGNGPIFMNSYLPVGGNYWSNYTGTGTNGIGNTPMNVSGTVQDLYPLTSMWTAPTVTFVESGLASGVSWRVSLGGFHKSSTGNTILFTESNGQYTNAGYEIGTVAGYTSSVSSGSVDENGTSSTVMITFTPIPAAQYRVTFTESGLTVGTSWSVTLNGNTETSSTGSIVFDEPNGTYTYTIGSVDGFHTAAGSGSITVYGSQQSASVQFLPTVYTGSLKVVETGLPAGDFWNFSLNGLNYTTNSTIETIQVSAGNYTYVVFGPAGYSVSPQASNLTMNGTNITVYVHFAAQSSTPAVSGGTGQVLEGLGIGVIVTAIAGIMGSFLVTGKFPWDLIRKK